MGRTRHPFPTRLYYIFKSVDVQESISRCHSGLKFDELESAEPGDSKNMRIRIFIIMSLLILDFLAINAACVNWDNPDSQTVDEMIAGDNSAGNGLPPGEYSSPQVSRAAQVGQENKAIIDLPISGKLSSGASNPQDARSQDLNQLTTTQTFVANTTNSTIPALSKTSSEPKYVSGSWSIELNDSVSRIATLTLFQNGDAVYGAGKLDLDANTTVMAAASGTINNDKLNLDMVSLEKVSLYRIAMTISGDSVTGSYTAFNPSATSTKGTAEGVRSVPST